MKRFGLPKTALIQSSREFEYVYRHGRRLHGQGFSLIVAENELGWNRLGISVGRKTGKAVVRNRIKRIIRESFRLNRQCFPEGCDIVVTVRPEFILPSPGEFLQAVVKLQAGADSR